MHKYNRVTQGPERTIVVAVLLLLFGALLSGRAAAQEVLSYTNTWELLYPEGTELRQTLSELMDISNSSLLFAGCAPMRLDVVAGELPQLDPYHLYLHTNMIENVAESRLRAAGLWFEETDEQGLAVASEMGAAVRAGGAALDAVREKYRNYWLTLKIEVRVLGPAFSLNTDLNRTARTDEWYGTVTVWSTRTLGTHGGNAQFVLGVIANHIDKLIVAYLRANAVECAA